MKLYQRLTRLYDENEAKAIVRLVLDVRFGLSFADILCGKVSELSREDTLLLEEIMQRLEKGEPVQYILGEADFCGRTFHVAPGVLIPRPETEELCQWICSDNASRTGLSLLDIGSGSGCIAITTALEIDNAKVTSWDISNDALKTARENAASLGAPVDFIEQDALHAPEDSQKWDIIVSNPPYITEKERKDMDRNVVDHEPALALFVPDDDALRFYRAIASYGKEALKDGGWIYFEINAAYAHETEDMLRQFGYHDIETRQDMYGKDRMTRCRK